jgi:hypothetical protein
MNRRRLRKILLVAVLIYVLWKLLTGLLGGAKGTSQEDLVNRIWMERMPKNEREEVHALFLLERDGQRAGFAAYGSRWRQRIDEALWSLENDRLTMVFPQEQITMVFTTRAWKCAGEAPDPFDLCLELRTGQETFRFYSVERWSRDNTLDGVPRLFSESAVAGAERESDASCVDCAPGVSSWAKGLQPR